jgi:hypothetical protein
MKCDLCGDPILDGSEFFQIGPTPSGAPMFACDVECKDIHLRGGDDVCCCGDSMENHSSPMYCGHSPVSMQANAVAQKMKRKDSLNERK